MKIRTLFWILSLVIVTLLPIHIAMAGVTVDASPSTDLGTIEVGDPVTLTFVFSYSDSTDSRAVLSTSYDSTLLTYVGFTATMGATDVASGFTETLTAGDPASVGLVNNVLDPDVGTLTVEINFVGAGEGSYDFIWGLSVSDFPDVFVPLTGTSTVDIIEEPTVEVGWIEGTVTDADTGDPIEGATVSADGESTTTDASGHYSLEVSPGTYDVTAEMTDYVSDTATGVSVADDQTVTQDFALVPEEVPVEVGTIEGTVTDDDTGLPIEGATVSADGESTTTDASGHYSLEVSPGTYDVTAEMTGYVSDTATGVSVADDQTVTQDFALEPEEPIPVEEHDVEAVSQSATQVEVMPGDIVSIDVTVRNNGDFTETFDVTCEADGITIGTILVVDLASGETRTMTFTWDTTGVPQGTYKIVATADPSDQIIEVDEENNVCDMPASIFVVPELPLGTIAAMATMILALIGYVGYRRIKTK